MKIDTIHQTVVLPATPQAVYEAFIDADRHAAMTGGAAATSDPHVGGQFTAWDQYISGEYRELIPNQKIVASWQTTEWPAEYPPSSLTLEFKSDPEGTELILTQEDVPAEQVGMYDQGWRDHYWLPMYEYFANKVS